MATRSALLISPRAGDLRELAPAALRCGVRLIFAAGLPEASLQLARERCALIFCSDQLCGGSTARVLRSLRAAASGVPAVVFSERAEWPAYLKAMGAGAFDYMAWPPDSAETERIMRAALAQETVRQLHSAA